MGQGKIKGHDSAVNAVARFIDSAIILFSFTILAKVNGVELHPELLWMPLLFIVFYNFMAESQDVYRSWRGVYLYKEAGAVLMSWGFAIVLIVFLDILWLQTSWYEEFYVLTWYLLAPLLIIIWHFSARLVLGYFRSKGHNTRRVAIVGATELGANLKKSLTEDKFNGFVFSGFFDDRKLAEDGRRVTGKNLKVAADIDTMIHLCRKGDIEVVYITLSLAAENRIKKIVEELADSTVSVYLVPDMFTFNLMNSRWLDYQGITAISIYDTPFSGLGYFIKRAEDLVIGSLILLLISLPMIFIALGIKLTSPGPVFFRQKRYGRDGREIKVWKFRSMRVMENGDNVVQATKNDNRITPFGSFLRRTSLDELPQFINVLQGSMSIVGPRPHAVAHNEEYRKQIQGYMLRHKIKPGITGLAQINGYRGETDTLEKMEGRIRYDLKYIRNWSLMLDIKIIFLTVFKGFVNKNAY